MLLRNVLVDVRFALRQLRKAMGFTLTAVLMLALGIGATTAIFSIVEGVLLRPLPFPQPDRLLMLGDVPEGVNLNGNTPGTTAPGVLTYIRDMHVFSSLGGFQQIGYELSGVGEPAQINASRLTASMFTVLGVPPLMGRTFTQQEDDGRQQVAVISYQMWHGRFHGDPRVVGTTILLDRKAYQIIGVMPRTFEFPLVPGQLNQSELWVPMSLTQGELVNGAGNWAFNMVGRLKPGVTPAQARQDAIPAAKEIESHFPASMGNLHTDPVVATLVDATVAEARPLVYTLFWAVTIVLFIACANLAGLLLVRGIRRTRESAVRLALGARSVVLLRQSIVESLLLSFGGGMLGLLMAAAALRLGLSHLPETLPRVSSITLDWRIVGFAMILACLTGLFCGAIPAFAAAHTNVNEALKEGGRTGSAGAGHARFRSALVVTELAVALVLLTASGLLIRSYQKMRAVDLGFRTDHALTASFALPRKEYSTQASADSFDSSLLTRLRQLPGVQAVGVTTLLPAAGNQSSNAFIPEGYVPSKGENLNLAAASQVFGDYFEAAGIPLLRGRFFNQTDTATSQPVIIVNRTLAQHYWPGQDPIGKRIHIGVLQSKVPWMTVAGEIGDIKLVSADAPADNQFYTPASQFKTVLGEFAPPDAITGTFGTIFLRSRQQPEQMAGSLRAVVQSIDPRLPLVQIESMDQVVSEGQASRRFNSVLISSFAVAAVLLALLGIYSVIAFSAAMRTHELAIRLALGSQRSSVLRLVVGSGAKLGFIGCLIGAVAALFSTRLLRTLLFQVNPLDPTVLLLAVLSIFLLVLAASVIPARRAASIEPMQALRNE